MNHPSCQFMYVNCQIPPKLLTRLLSESKRYNNFLRHNKINEKWIEFGYIFLRSSYHQFSIFSSELILSEPYSNCNTVNYTTTHICKRLYQLPTCLWFILVFSALICRRNMYKERLNLFRSVSKYLLTTLVL